MRTQYIDIPVQWHYTDWLINSGEGDEYYKVSVNAGVFYGRFLNYKSSYDAGPFLDTRLNAANKNDIGWILGAIQRPTRA